MSRQRIVVVEDDPFIAMDIEAAMLDHLGDRTEIIVTDNLREAQGLVAEAVHCVLLDVDVIGGKTFDIARQLRQRGTPFAFVSGSLPTDLPPELREAAFVRKPFRPRDIVGFVRSALPEPAGDEAPGGPSNGSMPRSGSPMEPGPLAGSGKAE
jgi:DNA-binding response OmpR family regulator